MGREVYCMIEAKHGSCRVKSGLLGVVWTMCVYRYSPGVQSCRPSSWSREEWLGAGDVSIHLVEELRGTGSENSIGRQSVRS